MVITKKATTVIPTTWLSAHFCLQKIHRVYYLLRVREDPCFNRSMGENTNSQYCVSMLSALVRKCCRVRR